jgi:hypothetical protein
VDPEHAESSQGRTFRFIRYWNATIAVLVTAALLIQLWIAIRAGSHPRAHAIGTLKGTYLVGRIVRLLSFFTIQSNILTAITSAQVARNPLRDGPVWRPVRLASLVGITVTGIVYSTVLAKVHETHGWQETSTNVVVHYIAPIMMVIAWLAFGPRPRVTGRVVAYAAIFPVAWSSYTLIRGAITSWYPYPFTDVPTHGYGLVLLNSAAVIAVIVLVMGLFWAGDRYLPPRPSATRTGRTSVPAAVGDAAG